MNEPDTWQDGMATESGRWPHSVNAKTLGAQSLSVDQSDNSDRSVNRAMPWFGVAIVMASISLAVSTYALAVCHQAKIDAWNAQTQSLLLRDYVDHLRIEMASHGVKPPDYPSELRK